MVSMSMNAHNVDFIVKWTTQHNTHTKTCRWYAVTCGNKQVKHACMHVSAVVSKQISRFCTSNSLSTHPGWWRVWRCCW